MLILHFNDKLLSFTRIILCKVAYSPIYLRIKINILFADMFDGIYISQKVILASNLLRIVLYNHYIFSFVFKAHFEIISE